MSLNGKTWAKYKDALFSMARERGSLIFSQMELTPLCNFNCSMCYVHMSVDQQKRIHPLLTAQQWIAYATELKGLGVLFLTITGGEPLTHPEFSLIYRTLYDMGFMINILSNGYLMDDETIQMFCERKPASIKITLYGFSDETYYRVCGVKHASNRVKENILRLKQCGLPVFVTTTMIQDNEQDIPQIKEWAENNQLYYRVSSRIRVTTRGNENSAGIVRIFPRTSSRYEEIENAVPEADSSPFIKNPFYHCRLYRCGVTITWDGRLIGCNSMAYINEDAVSGKLLENFQALWNRLDNFKFPTKCTTCKMIEFCNPCPGKIAGESGDAELESGYLCAIAQHMAERYLKSHIRQDNICETD